MGKEGLKTSSERFNYDYSEAELGEVAESVARLAQAVPLTHVVLNNNYEDQGQRNAKTLMRLLEAAGSLNVSEHGQPPVLKLSSSLLALHHGQKTDPNPTVAIFPWKGRLHD